MDRIVAILKNILILCISIFVFFACAEIVARQAFKAPQTVTNSFTIKLMTETFDDGTIYTFPPNSSFFCDGDPEAPVRINSLGFRGAELREAKEPGTFRIACLGDSFTFGHGVTEEATYARQLEEILNAAAGEPRFETQNYGIGGYNTDQELIVLRTKALRFEPDLVILQWVLDDFESTRVVVDDSRYAVPSDVRVEKYRNEVVPVSIDLPDPIGSFLLDRSHFYRFLQKQSFHLRKRLSGKGEVDHYNPDHEHCRRSLAGMKELCRKKGCPFWMMVFPPPVEEFSLLRLSPQYRWIMEVSRDLDLEVIDFYRILDGVDPVEIRYRDGVHYNRRGYELVAEAIAGRMKSAGMI